MPIKIFIILLIFSLCSCNSPKEPELMGEETWKLGWRMIENSWDENYSLAEMQFDSLLYLNQAVSDRFLIHGLEIKSELSKEADIRKIIANQPNKFLDKICEREFAKEFKACSNRPKEKVENEKLKLEIIELYVADQAIRGHIMNDMIAKYHIDTTGIKTEHDWSNPNEVNVDEVTRNRLKEIFKEYGFPTRQLIGRDAMRGIFFIIQHADGDKEWQKSQLQYIESGVKTGDFTKVDYAYLYDRIKVNHSQPQKYGSQFARVDIKNKIVELRETEELDNLDKRRREMGMMPVEMYKRLVLRD